MTPGGVVQDGAVLVAGQAIAAVGTAGSLPRTGAEVIDARGLLVLPGFIDLQINGAGGRFLTEDACLDTLVAMSAAVAQGGCTAFLPTVVTESLEQMEAAVRTVASAVNESLPGARVLGSHVEGPFINPARAGAHPREHIVAPDAVALRRLLEAGAGTVRMLTLAPELPGADELIDIAVEHGVVVSSGHTEASIEVVMAAAERGARSVTHLFNAMSPIAGRAPGPAAAVMSSGPLYATIVADGIHVHPANLSIALRAVGPERLALVTDAMPPAGTALEIFEGRGWRGIVRNGVCYLEDGTLAGSLLTMNVAVRNMRRMAGSTLEQAVAMASATPAAILGIGDRKGALAAGMDADIVLCDQDMRVRATIVEGAVVYAGGPAS